MARVLIKTFAKDNGPHNNYALSEHRRILDFQQIDRFGQHCLVSDASDADLILFVGPEIGTLLDFRRSLEWRKFPEKCFVFHGGDCPLPLLPGVYTDLEKRFYKSSWTRIGAHLRVAENKSIGNFGHPDQCDLLFSFSGAGSNHHVRGEILKLRHPRAIVADTSAIPLHERQRDGAVSLGEDKYINSYLSLLKRSKFVLCPRGKGTSSWRLFETMKAGRVPVIISDQWVEIQGPDWKRCSIRVAEADVSSIPEILEGREADSIELARGALDVWNNWFSSEVLFHRTIEWCVEIRESRSIPARMRSIMYYPQLLRPRYFRHWFLGDLKRRAISALSSE